MTNQASGIIKQTTKGGETRPEGDNKMNYKTAYTEIVKERHDTIEAMQARIDELESALNKLASCFDKNGHYCKTQANVKTALLDVRATLNKNPRT